MHERNPTLSKSFAWVAAVAGSVHAGFSLYWAFGGQWLLDTVGKWAVELSAEAPLGAGLALGAVALAKLLAALIPVGVAYGRLPWPRVWRTVAWGGGSLLVVYGGINVVVSASVLGGLIRPVGGYDVAAMIGHALLWDPLFFVWGAALLASLWFSQRRGNGAGTQSILNGSRTTGGTKAEVEGGGGSSRTTMPSSPGSTLP